MGAFIDFMDKHIWVPILLGILVLGLVALAVFCFCRRRRQTRNDYSVINEEIIRPIKADLEKKQDREEIRDYALLNCSFYMRSNGKYTLVNHLPEIGSRLNKHWFQVQRTDGQLHILTMMKKNPQMAFSFTKSNKSSLVQLFDILVHPCLFPVSDLDFVINQELVVFVEPFNPTGSLKDVIYDSTCTDTWHTKYCFKSRGLPIPLVQLYGRQILEILLFLERHNLPSFTQLHSGNVMITNNICRLTGYWSTLLGYPSKLNSLVRKTLRSNPDAVEQIAFGHMVFEMAAGYELDSPTPAEHHLQSLSHGQLGQTLLFVFGHNGGRFPTLGQIADLEFFKCVRLPQELMSVQQLSFPSSVQNILRQIKRKNKPTKKTRPEILIADGPLVSSPLLPATSFSFDGPKQSGAGPSGYGTYNNTMTVSTQVTVAKVPASPLSHRNIPPVKTFTEQEKGQHESAKAIPDQMKPKPGAKPTTFKTKPAPLKSKPKMKTTGRSVSSPPASEIPESVEKPTTERSALLADIRKGFKLRKNPVA